MKKNKYLLDDVELEVGREPWTMQGGYLQRINTIAFIRDKAYIDNDINQTYKATFSLFSNVKPRLKKAEIDTTPLYNELLKLGSKIRSAILTLKNNSALFEKNIYLLEEELIIINTELNQLIDDSGLIFPKTKVKTVGELREEDY